MLSYFVALASASLVAAWPAVMYSDVNCTNIVAAYSDVPKDTCLKTFGVQSYKGSLGPKQELLLFGQKEECLNPEAYPIGVIDGAAQKCIFIYKHLGPFGAAKVAIAEFPEDHKLKLMLQD